MCFTRSGMVEPAGSDRDGKPHPIAVDVSRRGLTIRSRRTILTAAAAESAAASPRDAAMAALAQPFLLTSVPLGTRSSLLPFLGGVFVFLYVRRAARPSLRTLVALAVVALVSSAFLFHGGMAVEANPVLRLWAEAGPVPFCLAKLVTFVPALAAAEWYRRRRPGFVQPLMRWAAAGYLGVYGLLVGAQLLMGAPHFH